MFIYSRHVCVRWEKLKFHSRNQDIIKVLVSWQRNEIFSFMPAEKKRREEKKSEEVKKEMRFLISCLLMWLSPSSTHSPQLLPSRALSSSSRSRNKIPLGITASKEQGDNEVILHEAFSIYQLPTLHLQWGSHRAKFIYEHQTSLLFIQVCLLLLRLPFIFYLSSSHLPLR